MATYLKANIGYAPVVESISRKFTTKKNTCSAEKKFGPVEIGTAYWMGGACRKGYRAGIEGAAKNYFVFRQNARTSGLSNDEVESRALFSEIAQSVPVLLHNLTHITRIQQMWLTAREDFTKRVNGKSAKGYTFKGWVWAVQYNGKLADPSYDLTTFPQNFDA